MVAVHARSDEVQRMVHGLIQAFERAVRWLSSLFVTLEEVREEARRVAGYHFDVFSS